MTGRDNPPASAKRSSLLPGEVVLSLRGACLGFGDRTLWDGLHLDVRAGELVAVLGANGSGKSSLLKVILGQLPLRAGTVEFLGQPVRGGNRRIGYVPQQKLFDEATPLRGQDLIGLGVDGHRWGIPLPRRARRTAVADLVASVHAESTAHAPISRLSGGEQERLRVAQALAGNPALLLCDEPLLSLDLAHQRLICDLVDQARRDAARGVLFVTHDINPLLGAVDRVLYLVDGRFRIGTPDQVLRTEVLTELYGSPVEVIRSRDRILVAGVPGHPHHTTEPEV